MTVYSAKEIREALIYTRLNEHFKEAETLIPKSQIVGLFTQGSQNYNLDIEGSDLDTKLIVVPTFRDICLNKKPISTTHVRANNEHIDLKDIRLYMETFRKQNLNFLEILFTPYAFVPVTFYDEWERLVEVREDIARMNPIRAVKSMKGIALEKYHAMEHPYPSKIDLIEKYGYDPKQTSHLVRVEEYLERYIAGEEYEACLQPVTKRDLIMDLKLKKYSLEEAREIAKESLAHVEEMATAFCKNKTEEENTNIRELLEDVSYNIMKIATKKELG